MTVRIMALLILTELSGCAAYTAASIGTTIATGKSIPDHALSEIANGDCNLFHLWKGQYYCEVEPVYNRYPL
jgi:hypothetical protein